ncbi:origin recognition complex subunit 1 [Plasmodium gonderi]|uniref:Origin recognition complex subunit 1 n=1 Tax=Plasmodium gonderi TaxID=77519 RepID=A0A1Y1JMR4_PLAGO|nr:origin recognition complex subunit 1 [Plasmodium gonderi]GAW82765.1 origin recognition complex subunit 1 [Plasmodium gonderi]
MTSKHFFQNFHMNDSEILSPTKKGIKLDVSKLNILNFPNTPKKKEQKKNENYMLDYKKIPKNTHDFYFELNQINQVNQTVKKTTNRAHTSSKEKNRKEKYDFDKSSSSLFSSSVTSYTCSSDSNSSAYISHALQTLHTSCTSSTSSLQNLGQKKKHNKRKSHSKNYEHMRRSPRNLNPNKTGAENYVKKQKDAEAGRENKRYSERRGPDKVHDEARVLRSASRSKPHSKPDRKSGGKPHSKPDSKSGGKANRKSISKHNSLKPSRKQSIKKDHKKVISATRSSVLLKRKSECLTKDSYMYSNLVKRAKTGRVLNTTDTRCGSSITKESTQVGSEISSQVSSEEGSEEDYQLSSEEDSQVSSDGSFESSNQGKISRSTRSNKLTKKNEKTHQNAQHLAKQITTVNKRSSMLPMNQQKNKSVNESKEQNKEFTNEEVAKLTKNTSIIEVDTNCCQYEDGIIYESVLINKVKYCIGDNVMVFYANNEDINEKGSSKRLSKHKKQTKTYKLRKGKISSFYQNTKGNNMQVEICIYFDQTDESYIKELAEKQKSRRSKADFENFLDEKTKNFYLLGNIEFKILDAKMILKKIHVVHNEEELFDKDKISKPGKDKFLCTHYLKEREERICEVQNDEHWENLVLGSSDLYYCFSNNKKSSKNKSLKLIIDKLKVNEMVDSASKREGSSTSSPAKNQKSSTTTHSKSKESSVNTIMTKNKAKTTTNGESISKKGAANNFNVDIKHFIKQDQENYYVNLLRNITDPTDKAIRMMQLDVVPKYLPCREKEIKEVHGFLESGIKQSGSNQILYISGMPGTGKTATVYSVIQLLQYKSKQKLIPEFNVFEINGMNVVHPNAAYQVFYKQVFNKKPPNALNSFKILDRLFNQNKKDSRKVSILIIDEIDYLITRTQKVLFTLFDWPTKVNSKLVLVAISNTMDLPERLIPRCRSRLAFGRLVFSPYKGDEIEKIIKERLENCKEIIDHTAIQLCARKVANVSGDIRKALQICRKAFENKRGQKIVPRDITEATNQLFDSPLTNAINYLPWPFKMFLTCVIVELRMLNEFIIPYKKVLNRYKVLVETSGRCIGMCSNSELFKIMLDKLVKMGILLIRPYIPLEKLAKNKNKEMLLGFNESSKKNSADNKSTKTQVSAEIDKESGDMGIELNVETQLIITALMKDSECSQKLNFY